MRNAGAARRRQEPEPEPPDPIAEAVADLGRLSAETGELVGRMNRRDGEIAASAATIAAMAAGCADAGQMAAQGEKIADRQALQLIETISLGAHWAEAREVLERVEPQLGTIAMMREAWIAEGRRREAAERDAAPRAPRGRHAARKRHLRVAGGVAASSAVAASLVAGSAVIASQDSAAVHHWSPSPASVRLHAGPADSAVLVPPVPSRAYVPKHAKPSADAASASPAPSPSLPASASPSPSAPVSQPSAAVSGVLDVQTALCVIGPDGTGKITFTAVGGEVEWQASPSPDLSLSDDEGLLADGHPGVITVTVRAGALAGSGTVTLTDGHGNATQVQVSWVALPAI